MAVTIREVATAAGVSTAAVSKVLHGRGGTIRVSDERARHIRDIAAQLAYIPNNLARSLRSSRTQTIGLLFEDLAGIAKGPLYTMHLIDGVSEEAFSRHYRLTLLSELNAMHGVESLADGRLDGVIWCRLARDARILHDICSCPIPIVALNTTAPSQPGRVVFVDCDNEGGIELAVDHLWALGHRNILFVREAHEVNVPDGIVRMQAFRKAMWVRGIETGDADIATWSWTLDEFNDYWASRPAHTAAICWSERCASQLLLRCAEAGVSVPNDFSVVGFDSTAFCEATKPRLTAVCQPIREMASHAAKALINLVEGVVPESQTIHFPCSLDVRESTGVPRSREN